MFKMTIKYFAVLALCVMIAGCDAIEYFYGVPTVVAKRLVNADGDNNPYPQPTIVVQQILSANGNTHTRKSVCAVDMDYYNELQEGSQVNVYRTAACSETVFEPTHNPFALNGGIDK